MLCPVCKTECGSKKECVECGFSELTVSFLSQEDYDYWHIHTVLPCQKIYIKQKQEILKLKKEFAEKTIFPTYSTVKELFMNNGFNVIDNRPVGGALWVIGTEKQLNPFVVMAEKIFNITGQYGRGKATKGKDAWWTADPK